MPTNQMRTENDETVVLLADGWSLRSGVYDPKAEGALQSGEYVRLCTPAGEEHLYWDAMKWKDDPSIVMGAIMNAAADLRQPQPSTPRER